MSAPSIRLATKALRDALEGAEPKLHTGPDAAALVKELALTEKVCAAARARYAARVEECGTHRDEGFTRPSDWMAKETGTDPSRARREIETAKAAEEHADVRDALVKGDVSLDEAHEVVSSPEAAQDELLKKAKEHDHRKLKARARRRRQEALGASLAEKRQTARHFRTWTDDLGMTQIRGALLPELGASFVKRLQAESERLFKRGDDSTPGQRAHDAFVAMLEGKGAASASRKPEIVVVFDADRDQAHIPDMGPLDRKTVCDLAKDALFTTLSHDGKKVDSLIRHGRYIPKWLEVIFELGDPPHFDGVRCSECSATFAIDRDHIDPVANGGATSYANLQPLCPPCHRAKTEADREAGLLVGAGDRAPPDAG